MEIAQDPVALQKMASEPILDASRRLKAMKSLSVTSKG